VKRFSKPNRKALFLMVLVAFCFMVGSVLIAETTMKKGDYIIMPPETILGCGGTGEICDYSVPTTQGPDGP